MKRTRNNRNIPGRKFDDEHTRENGHENSTSDLEQNEITSVTANRMECNLRPTSSNSQPNFHEVVVDGGKFTRIK